MDPWWIRFPGRLQYELDSLEGSGIRATVRDDLQERGVIALRLWLPEGVWFSRSLDAVFPDTYPYTRPEVYASTESLPKHQHPIEKNLCLIGRATENWVPSQTLASLLDTQLPLLRRAIEGTASPEDEEQQGEPVTAFFKYNTGSIVLVDSSWRIRQRCLGAPSK